MSFFLYIETRALTKQGTHQGDPVRTTKCIVDLQVAKDWCLGIAWDARPQPAMGTEVIVLALGRFDTDVGAGSTNRPRSAVQRGLYRINSDVRRLRSTLV